MSNVYIDFRALIPIPTRACFSWKYCIKHKNNECTSFLTQTDDYYNTAFENIHNNLYNESIIALYNYYSNINGIIKANDENRISQNENRIFMTEWTSGIEPQNKYKILSINYEKSMVVSCIGLLLLRQAAEIYNSGESRQSYPIFRKAKSCFDYLKSLNSKLIKKQDEKLPKECSVEFAIAFGNYSFAVSKMVLAIITQTQKDMKETKTLNQILQLSTTASILLLETKEYIKQEVELNIKNKQVINSIMLQIESIKLYVFVITSLILEEENEYSKSVKILTKCLISSNICINTARSLYDVIIEEDDHLSKLVSQGDHIKERLRLAEQGLEYFPKEFYGEVELILDKAKFFELKIKHEELWLPYLPRYYPVDK